MSDLIVTDPQMLTQSDDAAKIGTPLRRRFVDNGDGTWSEKINAGFTTGTGASASQSQGNTASGSTAVGNPVRMGAIYKATKVTRADGQVVDIITDINENQWVRESYAPGYEDNVVNRALVEQRNAYNYIATATTTTVKSGPGFLHKIIVEGGTTGTIIVYDNTAGSGTIIASFDTTTALASYEFNVTFTTGLTIVTSAATKVTVAYR